MKKVLFLMLIAVLMMTFIGNVLAAEERTVVFVNPLVGHPVYNMQEKGFKWAAEDYGFEPVITGPSSIDASMMVREIENAMVQDVDGIITVPFNWSAFSYVYKKAQKKEIPIVNTGADTPNKWRLAFIGTDNKAYGKKAAEILIDKTGGKANVLIMMSQLDVQNQVEIKTSFEKAIKDYPDMKIVTVAADKADMAVAMQKFQEVYRAYPEIDTVLMLEATGGVAAAKVAEEMGRDDITILAIDDMKQTVDYIRKGKIWGTLAQNFYKMGYESAKFIMDYHAGKDVPSEDVDSGAILITKENVNNYEKDMLKAVNFKSEKDIDKLVQEIK